MKVCPSEYTVGRADGEPIEEGARFVILRIDGSDFLGNAQRVIAAQCARLYAKSKKPEYLKRGADLVEFVMDAAIHEHVREGRSDKAIGAAIFGALAAQEMRHHAKPNVPNRPKPDSPDRKA